MGIVRSILGVVAGFILSMILIMVVETIPLFIYPIPDGRTPWEHIDHVQKDEAAMKAWILSLPTSAMAIVLAAWSLAAFFGGALTALIAGRGHIWHASVIGLIILAGTIVNFRMMRDKCGIVHPDWMVLMGLLLPIPLSMLGGQLAALVFPPSQPQANPQ